MFPTRTAVSKSFAISRGCKAEWYVMQRFGLALNFDGHLNLRLQKYARDFDVIDKTCHCATCDFGNGVSRSYLHHLAGRETVGAHAVTIHNIAYQVRPTICTTV